MTTTFFDRVTDRVGGPVVRLRMAPAATGTYFGGLPQTAAAFEWPRHDGKALTFIGQLDLAALPLDEAAPWLPSTGRLLFFYDAHSRPVGYGPEERGGWRLIHDTATGNMTAVMPPEDLPNDYRMFGLKHLAGEKGVCLPTLQRVSFAQAGITADEELAYDELLEFQHGDEPCHQIGGYPIPVQFDDMEDDCLRGIDTAGDHANDWKLLLQYDSDDDLGVMWGDKGMLYFWIRERDARQGNFDDVWLVLQCG